MIFQNHHATPDSAIFHTAPTQADPILPHAVPLLPAPVMDVRILLCQYSGRITCRYKTQHKIINVTARTTGIINIKRFAITFPIFISPHFSSVYCVWNKKLIWFSIISAQNKISTPGRAYFFCIPSESEFFSIKKASLLTPVHPTYHLPGFLQWFFGFRPCHSSGGCSGISPDSLLSTLYTFMTI